jgi:hypothetical protein
MGPFQSQQATEHTSSTIEAAKQLTHAPRHTYILLDPIGTFTVLYCECHCCASRRQDWGFRCSTHIAILMPSFTADPLVCLLAALTVARRAAVRQYAPAAQAALERRLICSAIAALN